MVANYSKLADIYEFVMRKVRYDRWSEYLYCVTRAYLPNSPVVLELASGKCSFAKLFSKYYPDIIVTDLSLNMLKGGSELQNRVCCDMTRLPFRSKFDLVYSTFDSVNYLLSARQLLNLFKQVSYILSDEGIFAFDCSMEKNSLLHTEEPVRIGKYNGLSYIHRSKYDKEKKIHTNSFEITDSDGKTYKEVHKQRIYPFETYFDLTPRAGLYVADCYKAFSFVKGNTKSERLQFILKKAGNNAVV